VAYLAPRGANQMQGGNRSMKKFLVVVVSVLVALGLGLGTALSADAPKGPVKVTNFGGKEVVTFDHGKHSGAKCADCHHNEKDGKFKCGECHKKEKGKASGLKDAMHGEKGVCKSCHFGDKAAKKLSCNGCHKK
jgi:hypothetical protein